MAKKPATNWPASKIEMTSLADLVPHARNARKHSEAQIDRIASSISRYGFTIPVLAAEDGTIIAGHGRVMAASALGLDEVPVMVARGWSDEMIRSYMLADNRLAETSEWDLDLLRAELADLSAEDDLDLSTIGFDEATLNQLASGTFAPNLLPGAEYQKVTDDAVAKADAALKKRATDAAGQKLVDVLCPHCAQEFQIDAKSLS